MDSVDVSAVDVQANDLLSAVLDTLPCELEPLVRALVGPSLEASTDDPDAQPAVPSGTAPNPIGWAPHVLALCCYANAQPIAMAIPVGACLRLLGIVSCALDAAQDGHHKLIGACGNDSPQDSAYQCDPRLSTALLSNIGVALIGVAWKLLLEYGPRYGATRETLMTIGQLIADRWATICRAQHLDLTVGRSPLLSLEEYDVIVASKAGEIGGTACEAAAILAGVPQQRGLWHELGLMRTIAQQLCDDFRDLDHDLANGQQVSQPVLYGLLVAPDPKREQLLRLLAQARGASRPAARARRALILELEDLGAVHFALASLAVHRQAALEALVELQLVPPLHQWFLQWILDTTVVPRLAAMESRRNGGS